MFVGDGIYEFVYEGVRVVLIVYLLFSEFGDDGFCWLLLMDLVDKNIEYW